MNLLQAIDPVAFSLGSLEVRWYGVIIAFGIIVAFLVAQKEMVKRGFHPDYLTDLLIWAVPIAIISARIYYVIFKWDYYGQNPGKIIEIWNGGIAIHGALIGAFLTAYFFTKKTGTSFWKVTDIVAPSILIGQTVGRWGNFMNQEAHGGEVTRSFLENLMLPDWIINQMYIDGKYYHPTFLYESVWNLIGVIILILLRKVNLRRGEMVLFYLTWYSVGRFFIEGMRTDSLYLIGDLRQAQVISLVTIAVAIILFVYRRMTVKPVVRYQDK
ncbi:prolipoprotein diacylglyceryl transferase [Psychrobacillus sp. OK032]|uniref:prolipoprotein diacylglyceryl transferase n=1 Tax=Psychrobacillus sp. OK032 TaxID=1884358 RepID=UPI0008C859A4|nr:prolipoprotein diacylglyceryl transferase [Psychrobacillus sp. OK032]SES18283.1 phosphatidylglycerol:prolipoprotein diacylglycerol transferase [Psychrobacillus sp. OK032]